MSITLELSEELESALATEAARRGLSLSEYTAELLSTRTLPASVPTTGAELVDYWKREGVIGTRPNISDSAAHARQLRHSAERRAQS